jgi:hypothetical protein
LAAELKKEPGIDVQLVDGDNGEFSVALNGKEIARKTDSLPTVNEVVQQVKNARLGSAA